MDVCVCSECCVLSSRGLCDELITCPEEPYRLWCVVVCDLETSIMRRPWPTGVVAPNKKSGYIFHILNTRFNIQCSAFSDKVCFCILLGFTEYAVIVNIITLFVFLMKRITTRRCQYFLCLESKRPLSCDVLNYLKTTLNSRKSGHNLHTSTSRHYSVNQLRHLSVQTSTDSSCTSWLHVKYTYVISVNKFFVCQLYFWRVFF